jgi:L-2,4-diaminobutyric acid acetyltransferase
MSGNKSERVDGRENTATGHVVIEKPTKSDGAAIWRIARDSKKLDLNSSYAYVLWCQDFADSSAVARVDGDAVGFVIGYRKQSAQDTAVVWQVAVDASQRGRGLAGRLLDGLCAALHADGVRYLETTITPDNQASIALFESFAARWQTEMVRSDFLAAEDFPDEHEQEDLYRIGPFEHAPRSS